MNLVLLSLWEMRLLLIYNNVRHIRDKLVLKFFSWWRSVGLIDMALIIGLRCYRYGTGDPCSTRPVWWTILSTRGTSYLSMTAWWDIQLLLAITMVSVVWPSCRVYSLSLLLQCVQRFLFVVPSKLKDPHTHTDTGRVKSPICWKLFRLL